MSAAAWFAIGFACGAIAILIAISLVAGWHETLRNGNVDV